MLIEAMKELKLIEKKMQSNSKKITEYASSLSNEKELFGSAAESRLANFRGEKSDVTVVQHYKERDKNNNLAKWQDFFASIDGRLEVVNATTELIEN